MAARAGLDALRSQVLSTTGAEERVEVNQRHLIDKILARYSAEFVVYRELMQNSDDAAAKSVQIVFETASPNPQETAPNLTAKITRVTFKNNGFHFRPEDWNRLKKIAEGNPDESKIGAFGVGFYSLFSICEEPFVMSGGECMAFYWRNDQLYAKRAAVPKDETNSTDEWTQFLLDLREPMDMVNMDEFGAFLARSIGFTGNLREISVYLNHHRLLHIAKKMTDPEPLALPKSMFTTSPKSTFTMKSVEIRKVQLDASRMEVSWRGEVSTKTASIFLRTASGHLDVKVTKQFAAEMERTTKKYPPSKTLIQILYLGHDEKEASSESKSIFKDLIPFPDQGRIFIGFPTHQTTGFTSHVAGRFIPTVERESIDFVDKCLQVWNHELLSMAALLSRVLYEDELAQIGSLYREMVLPHLKDGQSLDEATSIARDWFEKRALHALQAFQVHPSTPSSLVGRYIEAYFFRMSRSSISILSTHGVMELDKVRIPDPAMATFMTTLPTIPTQIYNGNKKFIEKLESEGHVKQISFADVLSELEARTLSETQMVAMLRWWIDYRTKAQLTREQTESFFELAVVCADDVVKPLANMKWFLNPKVIPAEMKSPPETMPYAITKHFTQPDLVRIAHWWQELALLEWTKFIVLNPDFEVSPTFAETVLNIISRGWGTLAEPSQRATVALLSQRKCIPTKNGMKVPGEAYFKSVTLFPDLPVMIFTKQPSEKMLLAMGVRKSVELQMVFDRLVNAGSWDHMQLVKYLASVRDTLSAEEIRRLRATPIFPRQNKDLSPSPSSATIGTPATSTPQESTPSAPSPPPVPTKRYPASQLYVPTEVLTELGLPVIEWKGRWRASSDEGVILLKLGLMEHPPLDTLLRLTAESPDKAIRAKALNYLLEHFKTHYAAAYRPSSITIPFLPTTNPDVLKIPEGCYSNPACSVMGFAVLREDLRQHAPMFGVREGPPAALLMDRLTKNPPATKAEARLEFEYLSKVQGEFSGHYWSALRTLEFIPILDVAVTKGADNTQDKDKDKEKDIKHQDASSSKQKWVDPRSCYFDKKNSGFHPDLLTLVDFGPTANLFLKACGVKDEPSPVELAQLVVRSPSEFLNRNGGVEKYKAVLRQIASHFHVIKQNKQLLEEMKRSPFLLGERRIHDEDGTSADGSTDSGNGDSAASDDSEYGQVVIHCKLAVARDIYLIDDPVPQRLFQPLGAPMEAHLETFYEALGSTWISTQVRERYQPKGNITATNRSEGLQELIRERAPLLLTDLGHNSRQGGNAVSLEWFTKKLKVRQIPEIQLLREFLPTKQVKADPTTACVVQTQTNEPLLLVTGRGELDYFDIADALTKVVLRRRTLQDNFWWANLLSSSLLSLKRKGLPVDRILNAKKAEAARIEAMVKAEAAATQESRTRAAEEAAAAVGKLGPQQTAKFLSQLKEMFPDCDPAYLAQELGKESKDHVERVAARLLDSGYPRKADVVPSVPGSFPGSIPTPLPTPPPKAESNIATTPAASGGGGGGGGWFNRLRNLGQQAIGRPLTPPTTSSSGQVADGNHSSTSGPPAAPTPTQPQPSQEGLRAGQMDSIKAFSPNYHSNLKSSLQQAVEKCRSNGQTEIKSDPTVSVVTEQMSNTYCDAKPGHSLVFAGHAGELELYLDKSCDADSIMTRENLGSLNRFVRLLLVLAKVFNLSPKTMHVFFDPEGSSIAFNRGGSLFFNWRYYVAFSHDDIQLNKDKNAKKAAGSGAGADTAGLDSFPVDDALVYWFFTMAHELAHNFVGEHNSQHEFYFSSFCEQYLPALIQVMAAANTAATAAASPAVATPVSSSPAPDASGVAPA
ncbi:hypothetical protein DFQ26_004297 [Actinomortierella ambigua]|nr:hypothetical protein DFQ26_004297 [Actinomortierella ambigua]